MTNNPDDIFERVTKEYAHAPHGAVKLAVKLARESQWQPIETAPAETEILCFQDGDIYIAEKEAYPNSCGWTQWWTDSDRYNDSGRYFAPTGVEPTHWMPLPEPPESGEK